MKILILKRRNTPTDHSLRLLDDGTIIHQTNYYPMGFDGFITVTVTDFSDNLSPDINEIARHIALGITID